VSASAHIARSLEGGFRLAIGKPDWRDYFDLSADGVFRSFYAVLVVYPLFVLVFFASRPALTEMARVANPTFWPAPAGPAFLVFSGAFVLDWAASIAALAGLTRLLRVDDLIAPAVVAFNWTRPVVAAVSVVAALGYLGRLLTAGQFWAIQFGGLAWAVFVTVRALRRSLEVRFAVAAAITVALTMLTLIVQGLAEGVLEASTARPEARVLIESRP